MTQPISNEPSAEKLCRFCKRSLSFDPGNCLGSGLPHQADMQPATPDPSAASSKDTESPYYRPDKTSLSNAEIRATGLLGGGAVLNIARELISLRHVSAEQKREIERLRQWSGTSGFTGSGVKVFGNRASIDRVKEWNHIASQQEEWRAEILRYKGYAEAAESRVAELEKRLEESTDNLPSDEKEALLTLLSKKPMTMTEICVKMFGPFSESSLKEHIAQMLHDGEIILSAKRFLSLPPSPTPDEVSQ